MKSTIAILTDFGYSDAYVGAMKGVISSINPDANIIDLTHGITRHGVREAAFVLKTAFEYFPPGTIFLAVIDPGVGGSREALAAKAGEYYFVAPNNGLISYVLAERKLEKAVDVSESEYALPNASRTFHGRDIFAPAAARLSLGADIDDLGSEISSEKIVRLTPPKLEIERSQITGEAIYIDTFGNIITSIPQTTISESEKVEINVKDRIISGVSKTFSDASEGELLAYIGSVGYLEIAVRNGNAARLLDVAAREGITVKTNRI